MRIMLADTSAVVRSILEQNLRKHEGLQIVGSVSSCQKILCGLKSDMPDIVICGSDTSDEDEKQALNAICNEKKIPVLLLAGSHDGSGGGSVPVFSKLLDTMEKPCLKEYSQSFFETLVEKLSALFAKQKNPADALPGQKKIRESYKVLCIGASTGGPTAVSEVLCALGNKFPLPVLYTQHIDVDKDKELAEWLNGVCPNINIKLAKDDETAEPGNVYMAPADRHLVIRYVNKDGLPVLALSDEEPERFLRPAVNKLFKSAALNYKNHVLAVVLTGMGADGAEGCKEICGRGGWTIVEDKSTCAVFGMPAAAIEIGGAKEVLPRPMIPKRILEMVGE